MTTKTLRRGGSTAAGDLDLPTKHSLRKLATLSLVWYVSVLWLTKEVCLAMRSGEQWEPRDLGSDEDDAEYDDGTGARNAALSIARRSARHTEIAMTKL